MLSYALAIAVATSSLVLFLTAFLMSDIHRKDDFLWSGVGLIYALVLWYCARNITGAVLLGQAAATALLVSYSWQTLKLRRAIANPDRAAEINNFSLVQKINGLLKRNQPTVKPATPVETSVTPKVTEQEIAIPDTPTQDTAQKPTRAAVSPKVSVDLTEESATVKDIETEPKSSEAKLLGIEQNDRVSNVEPISSKPTEAGTSTQDTEIVKPKPVEQIVVRDNPKDNTVTAKNIEATPSRLKPEAKTKEADPISDRPQASDNKDLKPESQVTDPTSDRPQGSDNKDLKPEPQTTPKKVPVKVEPVTKTSALDSLETVEVAEVLEAAEDSTMDLDTDRSNIIEVTTTEINITTEVKKLEPPEDSDFQEK